MDDAECSNAQHSAALFGFIAFLSAGPVIGSAGVGILLRIRTTISRREEATLHILDPGRAILVAPDNIATVKAILNIYAPNDHRGQFFTAVHSALQGVYETSDAPADFLVGGDFNCVPSIQLDYAPCNLGASPYDNRGSEELQDLIFDLGLGDLFRILNPGKRCFTWGLISPAFSKVRLDRWYTPLLSSHQHGCGIDGTTWISDHVGVYLTITPLDHRRFGSTTSKKRVDIKVLHSPEVHSQLSNIILKFFPYDPVVTEESTDLPPLGANRMTSPQIIGDWGRFKAEISATLRSATKAKKERMSAASEQLEPAKAELE